MKFVGFLALASFLTSEAFFVSNPFTKNHMISRVQARSNSISFQHQDNYVISVGKRRLANRENLLPLRMESMSGAYFLERSRTCRIMSRF